MAAFEQTTNHKIVWSRALLATIFLNLINSFYKNKYPFEFVLVLIVNYQFGKKKVGKS